MEPAKSYDSMTRDELLDEIKRLSQERDSSSGSLAWGPCVDECVDRGILDEIVDGYWEVDINGTFTYCNQAMTAILGYPKDELIGINYREYMDEDTADNIYRRFNHLLKTNTRTDFLVYEVKHRNGNFRLVEITFSLMRSPSGKPIGFRGIMRDITERQKERDLEERYNLLRRTLGQTVQALAMAFEVRDPYTAGHHRRVSDLARTIATEMGLSRDTIDGIRIAGSIHDIGKISIPSEILSKPGALTEIEFRMIKTHPRIGYEILHTIDFPWPVAEAVRQHHERLDGSGYPDGLKGDRIILEARIIAVADVIEAMSFHRPYRRAIGIDQALEEIQRNSGILYDPDVAKACIMVFTKKRYEFKE